MNFDYGNFTATVKSKDFCSVPSSKLVVSSELQSNVYILEEANMCPYFLFI